MAPERRATGAEDILKFYDSRGYQHSVGKGQRPVIIVIDFSKVFTRGASRFPGGDFAAELKATRRLLDGARAAQFPIVYTTIAYADPQRESGFWGKKVPWLEHCKAGTDAVAIDDVLDPRANEPVIVKKFPSAFFGTDLDARLRVLQADTLIVTGCTTSVCVRATALDSMQHGYHTLVAKEAVGDFNDALHAVHLRDMDARYADVIEVDELLRYFETLPHK
jgi:nicotinamidase-related amidase